MILHCKERELELVQWVVNHAPEMQHSYSVRF
jgi:hypothetical protein